MSSLHYSYVLIGGGGASSAAVQAVREIDRDGSILLIGQEVNRPYFRPALSKQYLARDLGQQDLFTLPDGWFAGHGVELRTGRRATGLDIARHCVLLDDGSEAVYDALLIATGAAHRTLAIPGASMPNVFHLRSLSEADRLANIVARAREEGHRHAAGRGRACVIGAGLLGVELASTLARMGMEVELACRSALPWEGLAGETAGRFVARFLESRSVRLHAAASAVRFEGDGRVQRVVLSNGQVVETDFVVAAVGVEPQKELIRSTAIAAEKAILVDDHARTSVPGIYAAGDCAAILDPRYGRYRPLEHWGAALATGRIAGLNMAGADAMIDDANAFETVLFGLVIRAWGEARFVERRIVRGQQNPDNPEFVEIGVAPDGRIAQVLAIGPVGDAGTLESLVRRRIPIDGNESSIRDPRFDLATLL